MAGIAPGIRAPGSELLVRYAGARGAAPEWHARMVLAEVGFVAPNHWWYVILTPDNDVYAENLGASSRDIVQTRDRPDDRSIPYGIDPVHVYDFAVVPTEEQFNGLEAEGILEAGRERLRLGATLGAVLPVVDAAAAAAAAPPLAAAAAPVPVMAAPPVVPAAVPPLPPPMVHPPPVAAESQQVVAAASVVPGVLGAPGLGISPVGAQGGLAALAAALQGGVGAQPGTATTAITTAGSSTDVRVLTVRYDVTGQRYREFAEVVTLIEDIKWPDSPIAGPTTFRWVCRFMKEHAGTPTGWHTKWMGLCKLQATDAGVALHEAGCRFIELLLCYDQCQGGALAVGEFASRQIQLSEEKWRDRVLGRGSEAEATMDQHLYAGLQTRGSLCICPDLSVWIAGELSKESAVMKEKRKAREERALQKPPPKS